jgi:hypothetical protein
MVHFHNLGLQGLECFMQHPFGVGEEPIAKYLYQITSRYWVSQVRFWALSPINAIPANMIDPRCRARRNVRTARIDKNLRKGT